MLLGLTDEEVDIINLMSMSSYLKHREDDAWMRKYLDKQLAKRRQNERDDIEMRYQRIARSSKGRLSESTMREMAQKEHNEKFWHPRGD